MIKKFLFVLFLVLLGLAGYYWLTQSSEAPFELEPGYRSLYDGESLAGWRVIGGQARFEARGESIVGRHGPGANTFLRTEALFGDFNLKLQVRWDEAGNSGILFRAGQREGDGRAYGYQYELDASERSWSGGIYDEARRGWLAGLADNAEARQAVRLEGWNDIEIEARGARLRTWINGVPAAEVVDALDARGFIALQVHSGTSGVLRWRRLRIREWSTPTQVDERLSKHSDWRWQGVEAFTTNAGVLTGVAHSGAWLSPRRQFADASIALTLPVCEEGVTLRMRSVGSGGNGREGSFAELTLSAGQAQARVVSSDGETRFDPVELPRREQYRFAGAAVGSAITFSVDDVDVLRLANSELQDRGEFILEPGGCAGAFQFEDFRWRDLKERSAETQFYQTLDTEPAPVLSPREALAAFSVAPGFEVELVAAEPLVEDPVAMAWDEFGRLYVVEMRGYMPDAYGTGSEAPIGQVVRLEDIDGDGQMDTSEVFLGSLVNPRAVAVVNEGVLVAEPPNLWLCEMKIRESLCTTKRRVGDYANDVGAANVEHMENGLLTGIDNWLYNAKSARSLRLLGGELKEREGLYRGQWGITQDDYGRLLYNHNSTWLQADLFAAEDLVAPGTTTAPPGLGVNLTELSEVHSVRVNPGVNRAYLEGILRADGRLHKATGVSGLVAYRGDQFPAQYRGNVFVPESAANVVAQFEMSEQGLSLRAEQQLYEDERWGHREFLGSSDERFRPVDAKNGPDGSLYVIDMYRGIIQDDHFLTDELREQIFLRELDRPVGKGRIWRVRHAGGKLERAVPALAQASDGELIEALAHPNGWVRDTAQRLLLSSEADLSELLYKLAVGPDTIAALHAVWALAGRGELSSEQVLELAARPDPHRQVHALRAGFDHLQLEHMSILAAELKNAPERVAVQLALNLGRFSGEAQVRAALRQLLLGAQKQPHVAQAVLRAVQEREGVFLRELLESGEIIAPSADVRESLSALAKNAYRGARGELTESGPATPELVALLDLIASREGTEAWQQVAMLEGLARVSSVDSFEPAQLPSAPEIFSDATVSEVDPLWQARLKGRRAFTWPGDELALGITPLSPEQLALMALGEAFYPSCSACHGERGAGTPGLAPELAGARWVTGPPEWLGRIILQGMHGPLEVNGEQWDAVMPPHGHLPALDDRSLAGLMIYLRRSWGNTADPVSVEQVEQIRALSKNRTLPWTVAELEAVPFDRGYRRFVGKYSVSFLTVTVTQEDDGLHMSVPMYGGGLMQQVSETVFEASAGGEQVRVEFLLEEDGSVRQFILHRDGEKIPVTRK